MSSVPLFSIVIPTRDREAALGRCLGAIDRLTGAPPCEVIVVYDGAGRDEASTTAPSVVVVRQPHAGPAAARNSGLRVARGRWVVFTDDDCVPSESWLATLAACASRWPDRAIGGGTVEAEGANVLSGAHQVLVDFVTRQWSNGAEPQFLPSNNVVFPTATLRDLGGFDETFPFAAGEDRDLCDRWLAAGWRMASCPDAVVVHAHDARLAAFCRMHYRYGRGARQYRRRAAVRHGTAVHFERLTFYVHLVLAPFKAGHAVRAPLESAALVLSQICHVAGYAREKWREQSTAQRASAGGRSTTSRCHSSRASRFHRWYGRRRRPLS